MLNGGGIDVDVKRFYTTIRSIPAWLLGSPALGELFEIIDDKFASIKWLGKCLFSSASLDGSSGRNPYIKQIIHFIYFFCTR